MPATIIDGKAIATTIRTQLKQRIQTRLNQQQRPPGLAVVLVGNNPASTVYVGHKRKACQEIGVYSESHELPSSTSQTDLLTVIRQLNQNPIIDGILVQLPLPDHIDSRVVIDAIDPNKDVDGFHPDNVGRLALRVPRLRPCTPYWIIHLLNHIGETYKGRAATIVGASNIVGRPMALELLLAGATVTV
ncbi:MAG TPA: bifunctional methylenetetrahydrofolate dehydrogenase/methenyltetrahydrofolate cyclohydrolase, partial [Thiothrix sp.]|nr:bifunctional methylenetetrahydrofolate dehydrogenase/methenyltetrahydrofolate cyclohydrolase [Thiothrix sp.]